VGRQGGGRGRRRDGPNNVCTYELMNKQFKKGILTSLIATQVLVFSFCVFFINSNFCFIVKSLCNLLKDILNDKLNPHKISNAHSLTKLVPICPL
jgi:hypothetical protein